MTDEPKNIVEASKAIQEVAIASGKTIDLAKDFGSFIAKHISGSLEQGMGIFEDKLRYMRWERQVRLMKRAHEVMENLGEDAPSKPIPLKLAVPLFHAATMEDDDYLQDMWVNLLVNSSVSKQGIELRRSYIDILERISSLEANILEKIYSLSVEKLQKNGIITGDLPEAAHIEGPVNETELVQPSKEVTMALANLARLGCVTLPTAWNGGEIFTIVYPTVMGRGLVDACTLDPKNR